MARRLVVVEDTLVLKRRGVVVVPFVPMNALPEDVPFDRRFAIELRLVDGSARRTSAILTVPRIADMTPPYKVALLLPDDERDAVPNGTAAWTVD